MLRKIQKFEIFSHKFKNNRNLFCNLVYITDNLWGLICFIFVDFNVRQNAFDITDAKKVRLNSWVDFLGNEELLSRKECGFSGYISEDYQYSYFCSLSRGILAFQKCSVSFKSHETEHF